MAEKTKKNLKKSEKSEKILVTLDETLPKYHEKNAKKKSFLWPGRAQKGGQKESKNGHFWALFVRENGMPCYKMGPERVQKVTFVTPQWFQFPRIRPPQTPF